MIEERGAYPADAYSAAAASFEEPTSSCMYTNPLSEHQDSAHATSSFPMPFLRMSGLT